MLQSRYIISSHTGVILVAAEGETFQQQVETKILLNWDQTIFERHLSKFKHCWLNSQLMRNGRH